MRIVRATVLAIIAVLVLLGGHAGVANANPGSTADDLSYDVGSASSDPVDPAFPPGD